MVPNAFPEGFIIKQKTLQQEETGESWCHGGAGSFGVFPRLDWWLYFVVERRAFCGLVFYLLSYRIANHFWTKLHRKDFCV
jgi:hypothetical protein